jgi:hypothetical protein
VLVFAPSHRDGRFGASAPAGWPLPPRARAAVSRTAGFDNTHRLAVVFRRPRWGGFPEAVGLDGYVPVTVVFGSPLRRGRVSRARQRGIDPPGAGITWCRRHGSASDARLTMRVSRPETAGVALLPCTPFCGDTSGRQSSPEGAGVARLTGDGRRLPNSTARVREGVRGTLTTEEWKEGSAVVLADGERRVSYASTPGRRARAGTSSSREVCVCSLVDERHARPDPPHHFTCLITLFGGDRTTMWRV